VSECDHEASIMRRPLPNTVCCTMTERERERENSKDGCRLAASKTLIVPKVMTSDAFGGDR